MGGAAALAAGAVAQAGHAVAEAIAPAGESWAAMRLIPGMCPLHPPTHPQIYPLACLACQVWPLDILETSKGQIQLRHVQVTCSGHNS